MAATAPLVSPGYIISAMLADDMNSPTAECST